jgi:hypothetical protein
VSEHNPDVRLPKDAEEAVALVAEDSTEDLSEEQKNLIIWRHLSVVAEHGHIRDSLVALSI